MFVKIFVMEKEYNVIFWMKISIYGIVYVVIYSRVDDRFIRFIDVFIMEIMRWYS